MSSLLVLIGVFAIAFLLGSIPWGLIISRVFYHTDIREHGSGNIGTTNAMRTMGKVGGGAVFLLDFGKGLLSGVIAMLALWLLIPGGGLAPESGVTYGFMMGAATAGCTLGHIFSPWLGFKGGKGIAVAVGCLFMSFGVAGACAELAIFAVLVLSTKYVSVGSIAAAVACPFFACLFYWGDWPAIACFALTAIVVVWAHRENIGRLRAGCERRIGDKKEEA
jgi:glycerol-3-phosphate acyltransferase PlsY